MDNGMQIERVHGREILDSRGNPTVEVEVWLENGVMGRASVPSGASTGEYEACELRDGDKARYGGKGVIRAVTAINTEIAEALAGMDVTRQREIDQKLIALDGTTNKGRLGANAILGVSLACAKAAANALGIGLYRYIGGGKGKVLPLPMMNILNGGAHAANNVDIQEFMILPVSAQSWQEALRMCAEVFHALKQTLKENGVPAAGVGDEGGYAPMLQSEETALQMIVEAVQRAGYQLREDFMIALDAAASEWYDAQRDVYHLPKAKRDYTREQLVQRWCDLAERYPIISLEDGMGENDWEGWQLLSERLGQHLQLVGDDLFVTNAKRLEMGIEKRAGNAILIKVNQIGTLTETLDTIERAKQAGYNVIISHRSGETEDTTIADLAVAVNAGQIKSGAPSRSDRVAKYNQLLRLEEELGTDAVFPGKEALHSFR